MPKKYVLWVISLIFLTGCSTAARKDTQFKVYQQDKERIDQVVGGALGNWANAPEIVDDPNRKKTRRIYVAEFTKDVDPLPEEAFDLTDLQRSSLRRPKGDTASDVSNDQAAGVSNNFASTQSSPSRGIAKPKFEFPNFDIEDEENPSPAFASQPSVATSYMDYVVKKDDTLQKVSKKFYDSYSKWPRIYEVNKEVIKDPNFIKPGIILKIPVD